MSDSATARVSSSEPLSTMSHAVGGTTWSAMQAASRLRLRSSLRVGVMSAYASAGDSSPMRRSARFAPAAVAEPRSVALQPELEDEDAERAGTLIRRAGCQARKCPHVDEI